MWHVIEGISLFALAVGVGVLVYWQRVRCLHYLQQLNIWARTAFYFVAGFVIRRVRFAWRVISFYLRMMLVFLAPATVLLCLSRPGSFWYGVGIVMGLIAVTFCMIGVATGNVLKQAAVALLPDGALKNAATKVATTIVTICAIPALLFFSFLALREFSGLSGLSIRVGLVLGMITLWILVHQLGKAAGLTSKLIERTALIALAASAPFVVFPSLSLSLLHSGVNSYNGAVQRIETSNMTNIVTGLPKAVIDTDQVVALPCDSCTADEAGLITEENSIDDRSKTVRYLHRGDKVELAFKTPAMLLHNGLKMIPVHLAIRDSIRDTKFPARVVHTTLRLSEDSMTTRVDTTEWVKDSVTVYPFRGYDQKHIFLVPAEAVIGDSLTWKQGLFGKRRGEVVVANTEDSEKVAAAKKFADSVDTMLHGERKLNVINASAGNTKPTAFVDITLEPTHIVSQGEPQHVEHWEPRLPGKFVGNMSYCWALPGVQPGDWLQVRPVGLAGYYKPGGQQLRAAEVAGRAQQYNNGVGFLYPWTFAAAKMFFNKGDPRSVIRASGFNTDGQERLGDVIQYTGTGNGAEDFCGHDNVSAETAAASEGSILVHIDDLGPTEPPRNPLYKQRP